MRERYVCDIYIYVCELYKGLGIPGDYVGFGISQKLDSLLGALDCSEDYCV